MVQPYQNYAVPQINPYQNNFNQPMPAKSIYGQVSTVATVPAGIATTANATDSATGTRVSRKSRK